MPFDLSYTVTDSSVTCIQSPGFSYIYNAPGSCASTAAVVSYQTIFMLCTQVSGEQPVVPVVGSTSLNLPPGVTVNSSNVAEFTTALTSSFSGSLGIPTSNFVISLSPDGSLAIVFLPNVSDKTACTFKGNISLEINFQNNTFLVSLGPFKSAIDEFYAVAIKTLLQLGTGPIVGNSIPSLSASWLSY
jgi:hypothetical protein